MLRGVATILVGTLTFLWSGALHTTTFQEHMVPIRLAGKVGKTLLVSPFEVTVAEWNLCVRDRGCSQQPIARTADMPVTGVNWFDVSEYITWSNEQSGRKLRLPTREEWRWLNRELQRPEATPAFTDSRLAWAANYGSEPVTEGPVRPKGSFSKTSDGISDLDGNVWEWTSTCAKPLLNGSDPTYCPAYVAQGEHEAAVSIFVREPSSGGCTTGTPPSHVGFRLVTDIERQN
jgi:formylglycine-generating enzyme required for sulfatase activity